MHFGGLPNGFCIFCGGEAIFAVESGKLGKMDVLLGYESLGCWQRRNQLLILILSPALSLSQPLGTLIPSPRHRQAGTTPDSATKNGGCEMWVDQINAKTVQFGDSRQIYPHFSSCFLWSCLKVTIGYVQRISPQVF